MKSSNAELIFLGTGTSQGIPVIGSNHPVCQSLDSKDKRLRSSVYFIIDKSHILIDCGPDFRQQMLNNSLSKLDAILFTHEHNDHVAGLDDVRPIFFRKEGNIDLYAQQNVLNALQQRYSYAFTEKKYPGIPEFNLHIVNENQNFNVQNIVITPIPVFHGKLTILGYRINNVAYLTDVSEIPEESMSLLQDLDILVLNALRKEPKHQAHFTLDEAIEVSQKLKPQKTFFTHISHLLGFHSTVESELPENVFLAYDGLRLAF